MTWNVIWQVNPDDPSSCIERDWFFEIFSDVAIGSVHVDYQTKPLLSISSSGSIIGASCPNQTRQSDLIAYLANCPRPRVLYHMSDEMVEVGRDLYQHCELVIRNGSANFGVAGDANIVQVPLGYVTGLKNDSGFNRRASERKCSVAFLGALKQERIEMLRALQNVQGHSFVRHTKSFAEATRHFGISTIAVYKNTVFVPSPRGNWNPECTRLYDALEWGCIPLLKRYTDSEYHYTYHDKLFGPHPIPTFDDWESAAGTADRLLADKDSLDALQAEILMWWQAYKVKMQQRVAAGLASVA
jgi:hypothetical protein